MIKIEKGILEMRGARILIEAEFCSLIHAMKNEYGEEKTRELFEMAMMPIEEFVKNTEEKKEKLVGIMGEDFVKKLNETLDSHFQRVFGENK